MLLAACSPSTWPGGIHAVLGWSKTRVRVVSVPDTGPARSAGLMADDVLVSIDGKAVAGLSSAKVKALLSGEVGSTVALVVERQGTLTTLHVERAPYRGS